MDDDNLGYEPMDVDLSAHSTSPMDISYTGTISSFKTEPPEEDVIFVSESFDVNPKNINEVVLDNVQKRRNPVTNTNLKLQPMILLSLILLIISVFMYQIINFKCYESLNMEMLRHNLKTKLYGQSGAAKNIIYALDSKEKRKMLLFYGGTGVGKTFVTSLLLENILNYKNIYHYTMPSFLQTFSSELMLGLLFCKSTVLVVDDLTRDDITNIKPVINELILKSDRLSKDITVILIFNCDIVNQDLIRKCDQSFHSELMLNLEDIDTKKYFIKFESLTQEHLRSCIKDELTDRKISAKNIDNIVKYFNVSHDGCKGVHHKLQYMKNL